MALSALSVLSGKKPPAIPDPSAKELGLRELVLARFRKTFEVTVARRQLNH